MTQPMTLERAHAINALLARGWLVRAGYNPGLPPVLAGVRLREAIEAAEIVGRNPEALIQNVPGKTVIVCTVPPEQVPRLYAWCIVAVQELGRPWLAR